MASHIPSAEVPRISLPREVSADNSPTPQPAGIAGRCEGEEGLFESSWSEVSNSPSLCPAGPIKGYVEHVNHDFAGLYAEAV